MANLLICCEDIHRMYIDSQLINGVASCDLASVIVKIVASLGDSQATPINAFLIGDSNRVVVVKTLV